MSDVEALPPGHVECEEFPRFGWGAFAFRFPTDPSHVQIEVRGDVAAPLTVGPQLASLPWVEQVSDFHCVTTWSRRRLRIIPEPGSRSRSGAGAYRPGSCARPIRR